MAEGWARSLRSDVLDACSAAAWMLLVALGLLSIGWRVWKRRSNDWLWNANILSVLGLLYALCFFPVDGAIAGYNVRHCRKMENAGPSLDLRYLVRLGEDALPPWNGFPPMPRTRPFDATRIARHQRQILLQRMENPWAWTDRRFQLLSSITPS
jgi:hypothetical protein